MVSRAVVLAMGIALAMYGSTLVHESHAAPVRTVPPPLGCIGGQMRARNDLAAHACVGSVRKRRACWLALRISPNECRPSAVPAHMSR